MSSEWEQAEISYWAAAAEQIKPEILNDIVTACVKNETSWFGAFLDWLNKPRGAAAVIQAQGNATANTIRMLQGN